VAQLLREHGYQAYALKGGLGAWLEAGLPSEPKAREAGRTIEEVCPGCGSPVKGHALASSRG
jgi:3-mercaptopyruvate sulfurtransferase SseA